eukprot:3332433-Rhodomonas_salina.1
MNKQEETTRKRCSDIQIAAGLDFVRHHDNHSTKQKLQQRQQAQQQQQQQQQQTNNNEEKNENSGKDIKTLRSRRLNWIWSAESSGWPWYPHAPLSVPVYIARYAFQ